MGLVKGMDWKALRAALDAKMDSMQITIDSSNEMCQDMAIELAQHKKIHLDLLRSVKNECATVKITFEDYMKNVKQDLKTQLISLAIIQQIQSDTMLTTDYYGLKLGVLRDI